MVQHDALSELGKNQYSEVERITQDPYFLVYVRGHPYPMKGKATVEQVNAINIIKEIAKYLMKSAWRAPKRTLEQFINLSFPLISPHIRGNLTPAARELQKALRGRLGLVLAHIVEFDAAYRLRFQDLMSESSKQALSTHPIREIRRLMSINKRRDNPAVHAKLDRLAWLICISLIIPPFRRQFREMMQKCDFNAFTLDEGDRYYLALRTDYRYNA